MKLTFELDSLYLPNIGLLVVTNLYVQLNTEVFLANEAHIKEELKIFVKLQKKLTRRIPVIVDQD